MTTRPHLRKGSNLVLGVLTLALFALMTAVFVTADFGGAQGFGGEGSITASIGYAMFNLAGGAYDSEGFLVAFEIIDVVLVAALAAAVMLARSEEGRLEWSPLTDGGDGDDAPGNAADGATDERGGGDR